MGALTTAEWAQVASAGFAAVAAAAAWAAVVQVVRERRERQKPDLHIEITETVPTGRIGVQIVNYGGPAKRVSFVVVEGEQALIGYPQPTAYMNAGESRRLSTTLASAEKYKTAAAVIAMDLDARFVYATAANGKSIRRRLKWRRDLSQSELFQELYPDAPSPVGLPLAAFELEERSGG